MNSTSFRRNRLLVGLLATVGLLLFAVPASASSLSVSVTPSVVRVNHSYTLKVFGSSDGPLDPEGGSSRQAVNAFSQKSSTRCAATASAEFFRSYSSVRFRVYVDAGPFSFTQHVNANVLGGRRICAYLDYGPRTAPQLTAGASFTVKLPKCTRTRRHHCSRT